MKFNSWFRLPFIWFVYDARVPARSLVMLLLALVVALTAQEAQRPEAPADTFSGNIVELTSEKLTVSRSILGGSAEKRTFLLKPETKVEGKLKMKAKVTVGFSKTDDGDVARLIVVREAKK